ncbi:MAG: alpha-amylase family glycosyl hydrolase, partial [Planctomycetota bacterium]
MPAPSELPQVVARVERVYGSLAPEVLTRLDEATADVIAALQADGHADSQPRWTEQDVVLITYADLLRSPDKTPLATLHGWLRREGLEEQINTVHLLPFCPYSSDDGFSVIDYLAVDPDAGDWEDIRRLGKDYRLMFDLVLNHCSQHSDWFQAYKRGERPYDQFFIEADPEQDLSQVVRP